MTSTSLATSSSRVALQAFSRIVGEEHWKLRRADARALLGGVSASTFERWLKTPDSVVLPTDVVERISHVLGIFKAVHVLFSSPTYADRWVHEPNTAFDGGSALSRMTSGFTGLIDVRRYLDAERGS